MADLRHLVREVAGLAAAADTALKGGRRESTTAAPGVMALAPGGRVVDLVSGQEGVILNVAADQITVSTPNSGQG